MYSLHRQFQAEKRCLTIGKTPEKESRKDTEESSAPEKRIFEQSSMIGDSLFLSVKSLFRLQDLASLG
jgi:hypothetical protein